MKNNFYKYQSLGNDFIVFDWLKKTQNQIQKILHNKKWPNFIINACKRNFGIGANGILVIKKNSNNNPQGLIFNSDGTQAEICLNGLRCIAKHLYDFHNFKNEYKIEMGAKSILCKMQKNNEILSTIKKANYSGIKKISINNTELIGHITNIGNPHFIVFEKTTLECLKNNGSLIESHKSFPNKTNVEFVWPSSPSNFNVLVYERGCGITLACSSGAASIIWTLFKLKKIIVEEKIILNMSGGNILGWINHKQNINLQAKAELIFTGTINKL